MKEIVTGGVLPEYDTPAKDYAYRAACREKLRKLVKAKD